MSSNANRGLSHRGVLHEYAPRLVAFEFTSPTKASSKPNSLIFVGGLTDGFCTVPYVSKLAEALEGSDWSLFSILLTSSYNGFGTSSLDRDVEELGKCVQFIRDLKADRLPGAPSASGKIAIMGHSTGSQDVLHYLYAPNPLPKTDFDMGLHYIVRPEIDGAIMQAPVSDREAILATMESAPNPNEARGAYDQLVDAAKTRPWTADGTDSILPMNMVGMTGLPGDAPLSARRFLSLASPDSPANPSEDDLFSSDLSDKRLEETFGAIGSRGILQTKLCVLYSGSDEYCPSWVDKEKLMGRWKQATEAGGAKWDAETSGLVSGASHNVQDQGQTDLIDRVVRYLESL
ncbi:Fusarinine C esterase sidJ [Penicillium cataractarum]|uniref:Fusarinine C esterase sidJ n=1 Tax=Penicillium cataractarum TaxID=2100454 RepID=A0A9X0B7B6_9EURO|nr:Fusarinine C esterase sidJ [Penicillium cataractarum]KAJ5390652.1 Fusarinine C esterase sidJ [Penicillium cataractarum]